MWNNWVATYAISFLVLNMFPLCDFCLIKAAELPLSYAADTNQLSTSLDFRILYKFLLLIDLKQH